MGSTTMNATIAMEGIPSIDEVLATTNPNATAYQTEESSTTSSSSSSSPCDASASASNRDPTAYQTVETIPVPALPARNPNHGRYYSTSGASPTSAAPHGLGNPVDDHDADEGATASSGRPPRHRNRNRSRSLFSFRSSSSASPRSSLDYGDEDAMVAAARRGGKGAVAAAAAEGSGKRKSRSRSRTNSVHAAAVLPAVLVLGAECFTPGHGAAATAGGK